MRASLRGLGTAVPEHDIAQADAAALALGLCRGIATEREAALLPALYRRAAVGRRGSVLLSNENASGAVSQEFFAPASSSADRGPGTAERLRRFAADAPPLAARAAEVALVEADLDRSAVTHLITVSCTGFGAPGLDVELLERLRLSPAVQRTNVGFMGCHGAINGLRVARAFAGEPGAVVLLCATELCSLHFHYTADPERMVANALFADGAAAAVIGDGPGPGIADAASCLIPQSRDAMTWSIGDHGFEMTLSARIPAMLERHLRPWLSDWLGGHGIAPADVGGWAIHPGGPRILGAVASALRLPDSVTNTSREVLAEHGNMSSPTVLFIAQRLRARGMPLPWVLLAFGPGLMAEAVLIR